jgi:hypothetical protein
MSVRAVEAELNGLLLGRGERGCNQRPYRPPHSLEIAADEKADREFATCRLLVKYVGIGDEQRNPRGVACFAIAAMVIL